MKHALLALLFAASTACAQIKISELPAASTLTGTEATMVTQGGASKKATVTQINAYTLTSTGTLTGKTISGSANTLSNVAFSALTGLPTTLAGYGITDALTAIANASGVLTNNGSGTLSYTATSAGGDASVDVGRLALYDGSGRLTGAQMVAYDANLSENRITIASGLINYFQTSTGANLRVYASTMAADANINIIWPATSGTLLNADGSGANLTALNATQLTSGTVPTARLGSGTANSTTYLRGDGTWQTISGGGDALVSGSLDQFADVTQTATKTFAITESTTLAGGTHSGTNTGDQTTITGNAGTATALQTGRTINGTSFDGTANITITAAAGTLTGATLNSGVTASSLTSLGTIATGVWQGTAIADSYISSAATWNAKQAGDADLTTYAGITPSANVQSLLGAADYSALRTQLGLVIGTNVLAPTGNGSSLTSITQSQISGLTTTDRPQFANLRVTHSTLTYAGTTDIDLDVDGFQTVTLTGNITFTTSNRAAGRSRTVRIIGDSSLRTFTFPGGWTWIGAAAPASLAASKDAVLTITAFGTADSDIIAAYAVEP